MPCKKGLAPWVQLVRTICEDRVRERVTATVRDPAGVTYGKEEG